MKARLLLIQFVCLFLFFASHLSYAQTLSKIGADIDGEASGDNSGAAVSISANGTILAIGAPFSAGGGMGRGHVRVFEKSGSSWIQKGSNLDGTTDNEAFGHSVSLDSAGTTL